MPLAKKQPVKKRRGPAPKGDYADKGVTFSTRITRDLFDWLEKAAKQNGRSKSQEAETRLRQTFTDEQKLADQFGDHRTALILRVVASQLNGLRNPENPQAHWLDDPDAFSYAMDVLYGTLNKIRPKEPPDAEALERIKMFDRPEWMTQQGRSAVKLIDGTWAALAETDRAFPPPHVKLTPEQRLAHVVMNKIPEIVERSKTYVEPAEPHRSPIGPAPTLEELNKRRRDNYYCIYCDDFYTKDHEHCPTCKGLALSGRQHGGDGRQLEPLSETELK